MQSVRKQFDALYGAVKKPIVLLDQSGARIWQNTAADSFEMDLAPVFAKEGQKSLQSKCGQSVHKENYILTLIPRQIDQGTYLEVQAEYSFAQEQQAALRVFKNASAKLNGYLNRIYGAAQQIGLDSEQGKQLGKEVHHILRMSNHLYQLMDRAESIDYIVPIAMDSFLEEFARAIAEIKPDLQIPSAEAEEGLFVQTMPENMELVLAILFSNAYRFGNGEILFKAARKGEMICVSVCNVGAAIEQPERLFEWGYRTPDKNGALGLGFSLATAQRLVELQGGSLQYRREGDYNCFDILLRPADLPIGMQLAEWVAEPVENSLSQLRIELSDIL